MTTDSSLQTILASLKNLTPADRLSLAQALQSTDTSQLGTPADGVADWQNDLRLRGLSDGTLALYSRTVRKLLEREPRPTNRTIRNYLAERLKVVSPTKVRNDQKSLRSFFGFLEEQGLWLPNPVKSMKLLKVEKVIRVAPKQEDVDKLLAAWQGSGQRERDRLLIAIFVDTGLRISEACSIRREDVDFHLEQIKVRGKGKKQRMVPVSPYVLAMVRHYTGDESEGFLFPANNRLGFQGIRSLEKTFRRLCKRLEIKPITPHQLRHYFATFTLKNGAKLEVISRILGHASVGITADTYRHVDQDEIQGQHRRFSPLGNAQLEIQQAERKHKARSVKAKGRR